MPAAKPVRLKLFADFHQIHVAAPETKCSLEDAWTAQATEDRIAANEEIVGVRTEHAAAVAVSVEVLAAEPEPDLAKWDHVTEASLSAATGELLIAGCTDYWPDAKRIALPVGAWRLRASHTGLANGREQIAIQLWQAREGEPLVLKRWVPPPPKPEE